MHLLNQPLLGNVVSRFKNQFPQLRSSIQGPILGRLFVLNEDKQSRWSRRFVCSCSVENLACSLENLGTGVSNSSCSWDLVLRVIGDTFLDVDKEKSRMSCHR